MDYEFVPAPADEGIYYPDALILYGVKLNSVADYANFGVGWPNLELHAQLFQPNWPVTVPPTPVTRASYSVALTYGYSFEGHCYRLDSQRAFIIVGADDEDPIGCGYDDLMAPPPPLLGYRMWRIRSSTELLEITVNFADAKTLILDANLPGKRSPNSYAIHLNTAHRNGRIMRD